MAYDVNFSDTAIKEMADLPKDAYGAAVAALFALSRNPRPQGYKKLTGRPGFRIRMGHYRAIYNIDDKDRVISVIRVAHRSKVYDD